MESGLLSFGADNDVDTDPLEAGLAAFTSLDADADFCGKAALVERAARPVRRPIVNVRLEGEFEPAREPWPATFGGVAAGEIRTSSWSPRVDAWIGIAQLATPHHEPGTAVDVVSETGHSVQATVTKEPFGTIRTI